jgi:hypothetical protein
MGLQPHFPKTTILNLQVKQRLQVKLQNRMQHWALL